MADIDLDGTLDGTGDVVAGALVSWVTLVESLGGASTTPMLSPVITFLVGGQVQGVGTVLIDAQLDLTEALNGFGNVLGTLVQTYPLTGITGGVGNLVISFPLPLLGFGNLTAYLDLLHVLDPVCPPKPVKTFAYMQVLQPDDLTLCLTDKSGNPYAPVSVTYAIYEVLPDGYRQLRGPAQRTPGMKCLGHYHATGFIGDCGQPGDWLIVWSYSNGGPPCKVEESFRVEAGPPLTPPCGCPPQGWT